MVEQPGFKKYEQNGLQLQVNDNAKIDVRLEVGEVSPKSRWKPPQRWSKPQRHHQGSGGLPARRRPSAEWPQSRRPDAAGSRGAARRRAQRRCRPGMPIPLRGAKHLSVNGSRQNQLGYTLDGGDNTDNLFNAQCGVPLSRRRAGVQHGDQQRRTGSRKKLGRHGQHRHQERHQRNSRRRLLVRPEYGPQRQRFLLAISRMDSSATRAASRWAGRSSRTSCSCSADISGPGCGRSPAAEAT